MLLNAVRYFMDMTFIRVNNINVINLFVLQINRYALISNHRGDASIFMYV